MGVPKFYRFISERYPLINSKVNSGNAPVIDNLYLDMNGVVHNCVRGTAQEAEDAERYQNQLSPARTHTDIFLDVFKYIDNIFSMIRPRKLIYFAIDGVAPRAKMNQQRSRRFRSARERTEEHTRRLAEDPMYVASDTTPFDSNCISPGTQFMQELTDALAYYVNERITSNPLWSNIEVVLSGAEAYGEGEHKIMEYIRAVKMAGEMVPNTRHCLYGLDADLIMLGLISHEPHFFLLREKVDFTSFWKKKGGPRLATFLDTVTFGEFELLSIGLLREYLALDIGANENSRLPYFDIERVVDDFVFMLMLVGNDFLPHLPTVEIADGSVCAMLHLYRRLLPRFGGYLTEGGQLNANRVELFVSKLALLELRAMKKKETERSPRRGAGNGPKTLFNGFEDLDNFWKFDTVFTPGQAYDITTELAECRKLTHSTSHNSKKHKYYAKKLGKEFAENMSESIEALTTAYLEGVVWTMKYYFEGCQSWRWFYPYHYAPFPSDLISVAKKIAPSNLSFYPDKPFLPLQQLMSVLPPASAPCVPLPYRKLMTSPTSPIHDFYVEDFKFDLNGKRNDWEAVVLLPFVDEKRLFEAIASVDTSTLTELEKKRNTLGDSILYTHCANQAKEIVSPFPDRLRGFTSRAKAESLKLPTIPDGTAFSAKWVVGTHAAGTAAWVSDLPTLQPIPHFGRLEKISINLFGYGSRQESLVVSLGSWKSKSNEFLFFNGIGDPKETSATSFGGRRLPIDSHYVLPTSVEEVVHYFGVSVGSQVWVHFPWRHPATVEALIDGNKTIRRAAPPFHHEYTMEGITNGEEFDTISTGAAVSLLDKAGVDIDKPKVLVEVLPHRGTGDSLYGNPLSEPVPILLPIAVILSEKMAMKEPTFGYTGASPIGTELTVGSKALYVGRGPFFGTVCIVKELFGDGNARVTFSHAPPAAREMPFAYDVVERWQSQRWKTLSQVAYKVGLPVSVANSFLGSVRVKVDNAKDEIDLGLGIKYSSRSLHIPGFAKVNENGSYFFSEKTVTLLNLYKSTFPELFKFFASQQQSKGSKGAPPVYSPRLMFPNATSGMEAVSAIASWISASEVSSQPLVPSASFVLHRDAVFELERNAIIAKLLQSELTKANAKNGKQGASFIVSQRQLRTGSESLDWENDQTQHIQSCLDPVSSDGGGLRLGDRVVNRLAYNGIPFGLRGTVVGIHSRVIIPPKDSEQDAKMAAVAMECTAEVVFDAEFISGGDLNGLCNAGKGKAVPPGSLFTVRPDKDNRYYQLHYQRLSKTVKTKPDNLSDVYNRRKAIQKAAYESYKKAIQPRPTVNRNATQAVGQTKQPQLVPLGKPKPQRSTNRQPKKVTIQPSSHTTPKIEPTQPEETQQQVAAMTAQLKQALGISEERRNAVASPASARALPVRKERSQLQEAKTTEVQGSTEREKSEGDEKVFSNMWETLVKRTTGYDG